ncbi:MAG: hypothetical protein Kow0062_25770 [Acidobacteriota bacterium]
MYAGIRDLWRLQGLDAARFDSESWNPLGDVVRPGDRVVVKPNLICQENWDRPGSWQEVITHPAVVRAVVDYILLALRGDGEVVICDGPQTDSDFDALVESSGYGALIDWYREHGQPVRLLDLRRERWFARGGVTERKESLPGDPEGYVSVDLAEDSAFATYALSGRFYGADYDMEETRRFHADGRHEYVLCRTPMTADVFVNVPKLKTHKKTGVTLSLKNLVGINGYRNCLPHHTLGSPEEGGDEFPDRSVKRKLESGSIQAFKKLLARLGGTGGAWARAVKAAGRRVFGDTSEVVRSGNWYGNDTTWRMVMDLNRILLWFDGQGRPTDAPRRYLSIVDGIIGGEGNGPLAPDPVGAGILVAGTNPWAVDWVAAEEMGLDPRRIPLLARPAQDEERFAWLLPEGAPRPAVEGSRRAGWRPFRPHFGWVKVLESPGDPASAGQQVTR